MRARASSSSFIELACASKNVELACSVETAADTEAAPYARTRSFCYLRPSLSNELTRTAASVVDVADVAAARSNYRLSEACAVVPSLSLLSESFEESASCEREEASITAACVRLFRASPVTTAAAAAA
jgi:hypothetical protein